jgi:hypothetical protein
MPAAKKARSKKVRRVTPSRCSTCNSSGSETFWFLRHRFIFDVDRAREITQDGRRPQLLNRDDVRYAVDSSRIKESHVPHVQTRFPGIVARVRFIGKDGAVVRGDVLIDGHHRAARCLQLGRPFSVYLLNYNETDEILTRRPDAARRRQWLRSRNARRGAQPRRRVAKKQR